MLERVTGRGNDKLVGSECRCIVAGECALARVGLTTCISDIVQAWTIYTGINGIWNPIAMWYFSPFAKEEFDTKPSPESPNILEPTQERALIEYILFLDYFQEGVLIEGLKTYMFQHDGDVSKLYEEAPKFLVPESAVTYWLEEARNDEDD